MLSSKIHFTGLCKFIHRSGIRFQNVSSTMVRYKHSSPDSLTLAEEMNQITLPKFNALDPVNEENIEILNTIRPSIKKSFNLAAYVNSSETLQQLLKLEVNISRLDKFHNLASYIVRADFKNDIEPYILFLLDNGVKIEDIGSILNKNTYIITESLDNLKIRINYFLFKKFSKADVTAFLTTAPQIFSLNTRVIDARLGDLLKEYSLTTDELRFVVRNLPQIIKISPDTIKTCTFMLKEEMGFTNEEIKSILLKCPDFWKHFSKYRKRHYSIVSTFDYVHSQMGMPHERIVKTPGILKSPKKYIEQRHLYLKVLNRAQYDPTKPLYVPLTAFYELDDALFCVKYAKTSASDFNAFLKTL